MYISRLALDSYRSWEHCVVDFVPKINIIYGNNGQGKTNIVEAIEFLSTGLSHRTNTSKNLIQVGQTSAHIRVQVIHDIDSKLQNEENYTLQLSSRGPVRVRLDDGSSQYLKDVVGNIKSITFSPQDHFIVTGEPALRRHFLDSAGSAIYKDYYDLLTQYTKVAKQRAALLKNIQGMRFQWYGSAAVDLTYQFTQLELWTAQLISVGIDLTQYRRLLCEKLHEPFEKIYRTISNSSQNVSVEYKPSFEEVFLHESRPDVVQEISNHYQRLYEGEVAQSRNLIGPHRDDLEFVLNGLPAREFASNGEVWSMALALKMALCEIISTSDSRPIVILDDVFAQLDNTRREHIVDFVEHYDQVIITTASQDDIPKSIRELTQGVKCINISELRHAMNADDHPDFREFIA